MKIKNLKVDFFFSKAKKWREEYETLRMLCLGSGLTETLKWGCPCYTYQEKTESGKPQERNIVLIHGFKEYCALLFFKGALLKDSKDILIQQTENVQSARQVRFTKVGEIMKMKATIKAYIKEAVQVEKMGLKVNLKKTSEFSIPDEFQAKLNELPALASAFYALTPGRQRGYIFYFSAAKQSKTRASRVEKYIARILKGKGLDD